MRCVLLWNAASGRNPTGREAVLCSVADELRRLGHDVVVSATVAAGSAGEQAREAVSSGAEIVFACGGDGTVHDAAQGLVGPAGQTSAVLGIIPLGSANALARNLGISLDPVTAARQQVEGSFQTIPVGRVDVGGQARYFLLMAGAGPDGLLAKHVGAGQKADLGRIAYYLQAAWLFLSHSFPAFEVEWQEAGTDNRKSWRAISILTARVPDLGGVFRPLVPQFVAPQDMDFVLTMLSPPGWLALPLWFGLSWLGIRERNPFLRTVRTSEFSCRPVSEAIDVQADGEWLGDLPMQVTLLAGALRIALPLPGRPGSAGTRPLDGIG